MCVPVKHWNKKWILGTVGAIAAAWTLMFAFSVSAKSTSQKVKDAKENVADSEEKLEDSKKSVGEIESAKAQLEGKLASLNSQLSTISAELDAKETELANKQQQIEDSKVQLAEAEAVESEQYESMKKRIQYMYENGNTDMLQMIFEGNSLVEMLNKADFFQKMTEYDREMLEEYTKTKEAIANAKATLEQEEENLKQVIAEVEDKKKEVSHLVSKTADEIAKQEKDLKEAEDKALAYEQQLIEQQNTLEALEAKEAEEKRILEAQRKLKEQQAAGGTSVNYDANGKVSGNGGSGGGSGSGYSEAAASSDLKLLATIIYCEAGNQPYDGMIAVGSVVMNRINSPLFPGTMIGVLYQSGQFTPVMSGRFAVALANGSATDRCYAAAQEVLNGKNNVPDCLFFRTVIPGKEGIIIGAHVFY